MTQAGISTTVDLAAASVPHHPLQIPHRGISQVRIERLILHGLDNHSRRLRLVDAAIEMDETSARFFSHYIGWAHERADWRARFGDPDCEVARLCSNLLGSDTEFVTSSRALATRLYERMRSRSIAPGDFVAATYEAGNPGERHVALLKLDPDQRLARKFIRSGRETRVTISPARNLLPDARRLQKCALLLTTGGTSSGEMKLLDTQAGPRAEGVATFFYRDFLTATLSPSPRRTLQTIVQAADTWLMEWGDELSPAQLLQFHAALRSSLTAGVISIPGFAHEALPHNEALRSSLISHIMNALARESGNEPAPATAIQVDRVTSAARTGKIVLELDGGARLTVPAQRFADLVHVAPERTIENKYRIVIESLTLREVYDR